MQEQNNKFSIPAAIILAGIIIAIGIIMANTKTASAPATTNTNNQASTLISFKPITKDDHIVGDLGAPVTILEYSDTECPFCKEFQSTLENIVSDSTYNGKVAWVYRYFPIDQLHSKARNEAEATECANSLGGNDVFWKYIDEVFTTTNSNNSLDPAELPIIAKDVGLDVSAFNSCLASNKFASLIESEVEEAQAAGAQGTPFSLLVPKTPLTQSQVDSINNFVTTNNLIDQTGSPYIWISSDNKAVAMNGDMPKQIVTALLDIMLK